MLEEVYNKGKYLIVCGDFNINFNVDSVNRNQLIGAFESFNLKCHVKEPTRITSTHSSCLDNIFSNFNSNNCESHCVNSNLSDHLGQLLYVNNIDNDNKSTSVTQTKRIFNKSNINCFKNMISLENWNDLKFEDIHLYSCFSSIFYYHFDLAFPVKTIKTKCKTKRSQWITPEIKNMSVNLRDLYSLWVKHRDPVLLDHYKKQKLDYHRNIMSAKLKYNNEKICSASNKSSAVWSIINNELGNDHILNENIVLVDNEGIQISDPKLIAEVFIDQFTLSTNDTPSEVNTFNTIFPNSFFFEPTDENEVFSIINEISNKHSSGLDGIPCSLLKTVSREISAPLASIINNCFVTGCFPSELKHAKLIPVFKKGDKNKASNYRPISLLSVFAKIIEKLVYNRLFKFLSTNNMLSNFQFGFIPGRSTQNAIFESLDYLINCLDKGECTAAIFFDLSKAFDTLNHNILLHKLFCYGIRGTALNFFKSYLSERTQRVFLSYQENGVIINYYSSIRPITKGVPQGSILGPLLFLVYVNDLPISLKINSIYQFADDTSCIVSSENPAVTSQLGTQVISRMAQWCNSNSLIINADKTVMLHCNISNSDNSIYIKINSRSVPAMNCTKFLGLYVDSSLKFEQQIHCVTSKLNKSCYAIRNIRNCVNLNALKAYYFAHVESVLSYGLIFWGSSSLAHSVFIAQKRIIRCMLNVNYHERSKPLFQLLKILPLPTLYLYQLIMVVKKNCHQFIKNRDLYLTEGLNTRNSNELRIPSHTTAFFKKGARYNAIKAFNALPALIKTIENPALFKKKLKLYLLDNMVYRFDEFY